MYFRSSGSAHVERRKGSYPPAACSEGWAGRHWVTPSLVSTFHRQGVLQAVPTGAPGKGPGLPQTQHCLNKALKTKVDLRITTVGLQHRYVISLSSGFCLSKRRKKPQSTKNPFLPLRSLRSGRRADARWTESFAQSCACSLVAKAQPGAARCLPGLPLGSTGPAVPACTGLGTTARRADGGSVPSPGPAGSNSDRSQTRPTACRPRRAADPGNEPPPPLPAGRTDASAEQTGAPATAAAPSSHRDGAFPKPRGRRCRSPGTRRPASPEAAGTAWGGRDPAAPGGLRQRPRRPATPPHLHPVPGAAAPAAARAGLHGGVAKGSRSGGRRRGLAVLLLPGASGSRSRLAWCEAAAAASLGACSGRAGPGRRGRPRRWAAAASARPSARPRPAGNVAPLSPPAVREGLRGGGGAAGSPGRRVPVLGSAWAPGGSGASAGCDSRGGGRGEPGRARSSWGETSRDDDDALELEPYLLPRKKRRKI